MFAVIEYHLEQPLSGQWSRRLLLFETWEVRGTLTIFDPFQVAVSRACLVSPVTFMDLEQIDALLIFCLVLMKNHIALIVVCFTDQPAENACRILRVSDAALCGLALPRGDVVPGDRSPRYICRVGLVCPTLDARE